VKKIWSLIKGMFLIHQEVKSLRKQLVEAGSYFGDRMLTEYRVEIPDITSEMHANAIFVCVDSEIYEYRDFRPLFDKIIKSYLKQEPLDYITGGKLFDLAYQVKMNRNLDAPAFVDSWKIK